MEKKAKKKHKCEGCVWGTKICEGKKYLCFFPFCVKEKGHAEPKPKRR